MNNVINSRFYVIALYESMRVNYKMDKDLNVIQSTIGTISSSALLQSIIYKMDNISEGVDVVGMTDKELCDYENKLLKRLKEIRKEKQKVCL